MPQVESRTMIHSTQSTNLADLLERVLDKGVVISGDIRINLVDIELLTIQIRLVICSVDRAMEMGMDWWRNESHFMGPSGPRALEASQAEEMNARLERIERALDGAILPGATSRFGVPKSGSSSAEPTRATRKRRG